MSCTSNGYCHRCEGFTEIPDIGDLYLWYPTQHLLSKIQNALRDFPVEFFPAHDCVLARNVPSKVLKSLFEAHFGSLEMQDFKALLLRCGETPGVANLKQMDTLSGLLNKLGNGWLRSLLAKGEMTTFFHPIVEVADSRRIYAHEALLRGRWNGELVSAGPIIQAARESDLLFQVDREARLSAIRGASRHGMDGNIFINFLPTAIYDPETCLRTTERAIQDSGLSPHQIVFEVVETEKMTDTNHLLEVLNYYRGRGYRVALDDLGAGFSSLNLMSLLRPDYVKLDMELIRNVHLDPFKATVTRRLLEMAIDLGIDTVVEGVETQEEFRWLKHHGARYAQGFLFGRPSEIPGTTSEYRVYDKAG